MHWEGLLSRPCSTKEGFLAQPPFSLPRLVQEPYAVSVNGAAKAVVLGQAAPPDHLSTSPQAAALTWELLCILHRETDKRLYLFFISSAEKNRCLLAQASKPG